MTISEAIAVLELPIPYDRVILKKNYRQKMTLAHPDNQQGASCHARISEYSAQEINEAYSLLKEIVPFEGMTGGNFAQSPEGGSGRSFKQWADDQVRGGWQQENVRQAKGGQRSDANRPQHWKAPENPLAYCERDIYHAVYDADGEKIGDVKVARGKFLWTPDEDFAGFLKSLFAASGALLDEIENKTFGGSDISQGKRQDYRGKLLYLLAQQFVDSTKALFDLELDIENRTNEDIFYIPAVLELSAAKGTMEGEKIYPLGIRNHRLYIGDEKRRNLGYLTFSSDIYSFILTPLFEQRHAQVKLRLSKKQPKEHRAGEKNGRKTSTAPSGKHYKNVDMWLKIPHEAGVSMPENLNAHIEELLREYAKEI